MADKTWKKVEREFCRALGGERTGPTGRDDPDCDIPHIGLEVKAYKNLVFLTKDWEQAVENAVRVGKNPVLAVREGGRGGRKRVQLRVHTLVDLASRSGDCRRVETYWPTETYDRFGFQIVRIEWHDFVALYRAAYIDNEEATTG